MLSPVDEIKSRLDLVDIIQEYVPLKVAGANLKGLCPFHREKTPSFMVHRGRQMWHCFGCNVGGDMFTFIQKIENVEFPEALEILAKKANVELKREDPQLRTERMRLKELLSLSAQWYAGVLRSPKGAEALRYLKETRALTDTSIEEWLLGYAPDSWEELSRFLRMKGYRDQEVVAAGLAIPRQQQGGGVYPHTKDFGVGVYDRFRDRIMFPLRDHHGVIVGFTGRQLKEHKEEGGKYVNTPETLLYHKRAVLFGLDKAKQAIRERGFALVVEGQMDVISLWQAGFRNVIASSGTSLNLEELQLTLLRRLTETLVLCFDVDVGGVGAALRGLELAWAAGFGVRLARLPRELGKDPDEVVRKDKEAFLAAVQESVSILEYVFTQARSLHPSNSVEDKKAVAGALLPYLLRLADPIERDHYLKRLSEELQVSEHALREALARARPSSQPRQAQGNLTAISTPPLLESLAERIISLLLTAPSLIQHSAQILAHKHLPASHQALYKIMISWYSESRIHTSEHLITTIEASQPELQKHVHFLATRGDLEYQGRSETELLQEITSLARSLKRLVLKERVETLSRRITEHERIHTSLTASEKIAELEALSREFTQLTQELAELE
ncbi:MAG: DNA primase [Patescibacteria group bacterium]